MAAGGSLVAVALVLVATLAGLHWLNGRGLPGLAGGAAGGSRSIRLGTGHAVHVVEVEGRRLLIGTGPDGAPSLLTELEGSAREAAGGS